MTRSLDDLPFTLPVPRSTPPPPQSVGPFYNPLNLFAFMAAHDLRVASPLVPGSDQPAMRTRGPVPNGGPVPPGCMYGRLVNYLEIQVTAFDLAGWACWWDQVDPALNRDGWGYDSCFFDLCRARSALRGRAGTRCICCGPGHHAPTPPYPTTRPPHPAVGLIDTIVARHDVGTPHASPARKRAAAQGCTDFLAARNASSSRFAPPCRPWPWPPFGKHATLALLAPVPMLAVNSSGSPGAGGGAACAPPGAATAAVRGAAAQPAAVPG